MYCTYFKCMLVGFRTLDEERRQVIEGKKYVEEIMTLLNRSG